MKLIPYTLVTKKKSPARTRRSVAALGFVLVLIIVFGGAIYSFPLILEVNVHRQAAIAPVAVPDQFPVTVNPQKKLIVENAAVNQLLTGPDSPLQAAAANSSTLNNLFTWVATAIANAPWYEAVASANAPRFVTITPGLRKEQVASAFAAQLGWTAKQKQAFATTRPYAALPLAEGSYSPGLYAVTAGMSPVEAQQLVNDRFTNDILSHYGTTTAQVVPLDEALTIASLIERETGGPDDMRLISGIIWNRLFVGMDLQIDATLQYAKAKSTAVNVWWPQVIPDDKYIKSPYNTYQHPGLPPTPIANPSVASVIAALNPKSTSCLFYFHDKYGQFHCSDTYAEHVALLKKYYGQGK